jgi:hypothetical protein
MVFPPITPKTLKRARRPAKRGEKLVLSRRPLHKENPAVFSGRRGSRRERQKEG